MTAILDKVRRLVAGLAPTPVCDGCLAERLDPLAPDEVQLATSELAVARGFMRDRNVCGLCGEERPVIRKAS